MLLRIQTLLSLVPVEVRMDMNTNEAEQMLRASRVKPHMVTQVVTSLFSFAVDVLIHRLKMENCLGDILAIEIRDHDSRFVDEHAPIHCRQDAKLSGLNVMSLGIWYETLMRAATPSEKNVTAAQE